MGIATLKKLPQRLVIESSAKQLFNFLNTINDLMKVIARACGYDDVRKFNFDDLSTMDYHLYKLIEIIYAGMPPNFLD